jgi:AcrR family transcriptional regulator
LTVAPSKPTKTQAPSAKPPAAQIDPRVRRSHEAVLQATFELLYETGVGGFSVDEVARRSGVAKTTIYRHWPSREALVIDACSKITAPQTIPDTGSLEGDLTSILSYIAELLQTANWASVLPSIVDLAEREPRFAEVHSGIQHEHAAPLREVLQRAIDTGELPADADLATMVAGLLGPLFYRRWFSREPIDQPFVATIIERAIPRR